MRRAQLLVEIGTEELPPTALRGLASAFGEAVRDGLAEHRLRHGDIRIFDSPRRLAVLVDGVPDRQEDRSVELKGPPVSVAFGNDGQALPAAVAFAKKAGVGVEDLERRSGDKGEWLYARQREEGAALGTIAPALVSAALGRLPIPRPMRWGAGAAEFVRPVHWVVLMHGSEVLEGDILGVRTGRESRGHRFHAPGPLAIGDASRYADVLEREGRVLADPDDRLERIRAMVIAAAGEAGGVPVGDRDLYEEVAALVEWPVPVVGEFDAAFLDLPREVVVATLTAHQRYFPVADHDGVLLPCFVTVANIDSLEPQRVKDGNERVIRPRLADAAFFWDADRRAALADRVPQLDTVVYQKGLGSTGDKARRVSALSGHIAGLLGIDEAAAARAGLLSKCDLLTGMVGEFPELQGTMGGYYAMENGEPDAVAAAIGEQYRPAFAGDAIPASDVGRCLALADRIDSLSGAFALGKKPSGNKDPFGLRRAALGVVRILAEGNLDVDLAALLELSMAAQPVQADDGACGEVFDFLIDRLRGYAADELDVSPEMFDAVRDRRPVSIVDFVARLRAVHAFVQLEQASALAAANKRIGNILRQAGFDADGVDASLLAEPAEKALYEDLGRARSVVGPLLDSKSYTDALARLADLRDPVDRFFDDVLVMADDETVRNNRLGILAAIQELFLGVADISRLAIR